MKLNEAVQIARQLIFEHSDLVNGKYGVECISVADTKKWEAYTLLAKYHDEIGNLDQTEEDSD